ncbi:MAG: SDR family NAD(P)-dependent oxidoreductase [Gemmatimonadetes bacterium]|nr:SDR family NAD(P)-dependent oxidoreductase [Gemmatimonadota bacterium]MBT7860570.1 SDR family NAD(P)-dependent oxidoreductase [Gemmatimonadota bacterium]
MPRSTSPISWSRRSRSSTTNRVPRRRLSRIQIIGGTARFVQTYVSDEASIKHPMEATMAEFGQLDILVNNTGMNTTAKTAHACTFLASDHAEWITGVALPVDGGWLAPII